MSKTTSKITEFFGDKDHDFNLIDPGWKLLRELEEKVGSVIAAFMRMREGHGRIDEVRETIRLGLIGGGKTPAEAASLVGRYFDRTPIAENLPLAISVLGAGIYGVPEAADDAA